jgi:hypothetical protein
MVFLDKLNWTKKIIAIISISIIILIAYKIFIELKNNSKIFL